MRNIEYVAVTLAHTALLLASATLFQALNEIIRTEYDYITELEDFLRQYATPLRQLEVRRRPWSCTSSWSACLFCVSWSMHMAVTSSCKHFVCLLRPSPVSFLCMTFHNLAFCAAIYSHAFRPMLPPLSLTLWAPLHHSTPAVHPRQRQAGITGHDFPAGAVPQQLLRGAARGRHRRQPVRGPAFPQPWRGSPESLHEGAHNVYPPTYGQAPFSCA